MEPNELDTLVDAVRAQAVSHDDEAVFNLVAFGLRRLDDIARSLAVIAQSTLPQA